MAPNVHDTPAPAPDLDTRFARAWEAAEEAEFQAAVRTARALRLAQEAGSAALAAFTPSQLADLNRVRAGLAHLRAASAP